MYLYYNTTSVVRLFWQLDYKVAQNFKSSFAYKSGNSTSSFMMLDEPLLCW